MGAVKDQIMPLFDGNRLCGSTGVRAQQIFKEHYGPRPDALSAARTYNKRHRAITQYAYRAMKALLDGATSAPPYTPNQLSQRLPDELREPIFAAAQDVLLRDARKAQAALSAFESLHPLGSRLKEAGVAPQPAEARALTEIFEAV